MVMKSLIIPSLTSSSINSSPHCHTNMNMNLDILYDHHVRYGGGFCMDDDDNINTCYYPPSASSMLFDDDNVNTSHSHSFFTSPDIDSLLLPNRFPVLDHHDQGKIDIPTEDVLVYFKDPSVSSTDVTVSTLISGDTSSMTDVTSSSLVLPPEGMEINSELSVFHLLMAYSEAMEMGQEELGEVIGRRIGEKVSPVGDTLERLIYYMFQTSDKQSEYLKQESVKNFLQAFKALYQIFPNGKFAHFAANLAILESLPKDVDVIRIFDFDIGEGIQWASLIEAIGHNYGGLVEVIITSVHFVGDEEEEEEEEQQSHTARGHYSAVMWKLEDTKKRLCDYARCYGLKLKVEEMEWNEEAEEIQRNKQNLMNPWSTDGRGEFYVFNCMVGLPHMGRVRSRKDVFNFLEKSQKLLQRNGGSQKKGMISYGDGDAWEKVRNAPSYGSFLDEHMAHYQALLESIKLNFPSHLGEARTAIECLFVAPSVCCKAWAEKWIERKKYGSWGFGLEGLSLSRETWLEAKELVREGESLYQVRIEGESHNEMIMEWRGIPMVKVSCWRN